MWGQGLPRSPPQHTFPRGEALRMSGQSISAWQSPSGGTPGHLGNVETPLFVADSLHTWENSARRNTPKMKDIFDGILSIAYTFYFFFEIMKFIAVNNLKSFCHLSNLVFSFRKLTFVNLVLFPNLFIIFLLPFKASLNVVNSKIGELFVLNNFTSTFFSHHLESSNRCLPHHTALPSRRLVPETETGRQMS